MSRPSHRQRAQRAWPARALVGALAAAIALLLAPAAPALAYWSSQGTTGGVASTGVLAPPTDVTVPGTSGLDVSVSWTASTGPTPVAYAVERIGTSGTEPACGSSVAAPITATSCVDAAVAPGTYTYRVIAVHRSWTATSPASGEVVVTAPGFLGSAASFSLLGTTATNTVSTTTVSGDVGSTTTVTGVTGFTASQVGGDIHVNDAAANTAAADALSAYNYFKGLTEFQGVGVKPLNAAPAGLTYEPGLYFVNSALGLAASTTMKLDAKNNPDAIFIFQINGAVVTGANSHIELINGAKASNVYWVVYAAADTGANAEFSGTILALGAITLGADSKLIGRGLSQAAVTLGGNVVRFTEASPPTVTITNGATFATKDTTPPISGTTTALAGRPVTVTVETLTPVTTVQTLTTTVQAGGVWSVDAAALLPARYTITVKIRDAAGNGGSGTQQLTVEVNPPTINLGLAAPFSVLTATSVVNTGTTTLTGELGVTPGDSVSGGLTASAMHLGDTTAFDAWQNALGALGDGVSRAAHTTFADPTGLTFHTGVHASDAAVTIPASGVITLDAEGDSSAVFIMQINGALGTGALSEVKLANGAQASNVYWIVDAAVVLGANSIFKGTILTTEAVTVGASAAVTGRVIGGGAITLASNSITGP